FAPLPPPTGPVRATSLYSILQRRYEAYKSIVVRPFFRDHFARLDRQIVLVDTLRALNAGPAAVTDLEAALTDILSCFRQGDNNPLTRLVARRIDRILFAATKADHLHHSQHPRLTAIMQAMLREAQSRADFAGAETMAISMASLRCTVEETLSRDGVALDAVRGRLLDTGKQVAMYPGQLPSDPARLLSPAREGAEKWLDADYGLMAFAPARSSLRPGDGPPHIRLDRAAEFLIGDRL
ncbi:MAG: YcjX family protein, partial [Cypionkella sp.]|uniref:YcjX family protein n=1 Tax=Cypionkella sp. TaxID=2811411 RepID=UPI00272128C8